jgi:hypothetical protein
LDSVDAEAANRLFLVTVDGVSTWCPKTLCSAGKRRVIGRFPELYADYD